MSALFTKTGTVLEYRYPGAELELFASAANWKRYLAQKLEHYISGRVLEVGAGAGETTPFLLNKNVQSWTCLEPDPLLLQEIEKKINSGLLAQEIDQAISESQLTPLCRTLKGTIETLPEDERFDTILYIDVLEHIEKDHEELAAAFAHLNEGGYLIVLSPAYQLLYSPFDKAIGHYRRYRKKSLRQAARLPGLEEREMYYLESLGAVLLLFNRFLFRKRYPSQKDIAVWQRFFVPVSKLLDKVLFYSMGKSIIGIWQRRKQPS